VKKVGKKVSLVNAFLVTVFHIASAEDTGLSGVEKKRLVKKEMLRMFRLVDIPFLPSWLESIFERAVVDMLIDGFVALCNQLELWNRLNNLRLNSGPDGRVRLIDASVLAERDLI